MMNALILLSTILSLNTPMTLNETLTALSEGAERLAEEVSPERLAELDALADWVAEQPAEGNTDLVFICTHNSRRSHMGQILAQAAAHHHGLHDVRTHSGGTEATAFNPRAVRALQDLGVGLACANPEAKNPVYEVVLQPGAGTTAAFSKVYSDASNPQAGFAAVMTCSDADEACPLVFGAAARFATPYVDPKVSDGTAEEAATYRERALQIGTEMMYVMARAAAIRRG